MMDLNATIGKINFHLQPSQEDFLDYNNNLKTHTGEGSS